MLQVGTWTDETASYPRADQYDGRIQLIGGIWNATRCSDCGHSDPMLLFRYSCGQQYALWPGNHANNGDRH